MYRCMSLDNWALGYPGSDNILFQFSLYRVTSALASITISHRILFCPLVLHCQKKGSIIQYDYRE